MHMTTHFPTRLLHPTPLRVATVTLCLTLGGCTVVGDWFSHGDTNYKGASKRTQPLEVPPDLTQLQRDSRYLPQGGVVTASDLGKPADGSAAAPGQPGLAPAPANPQVALNAAGNLHLERDGDRRWLTTQDAPENVLPKVRAYWESQGFTLNVDEPKTGILETDWKESRDKLPSEGIRGIFSTLVNSLSDSGLRDRYRTRLERRADGGTEIHVTHFGAVEQLTGKTTSVQTADATWVPRPSDPGLEATQLSQMMLSLAGLADTNVAAAKHSIFHFGEDDDTAASAPAGTRPIPSSSTGRPSVGGTGPNGAARAHVVTGQAGATLEVEDNFDRSWRRVGLALDHGGFTVEDRDRAQGLYYVRYVDAKEAAREEPGFFSKITSWFGKSNTSAVGKYRISIKASGDTATVTVLNDQGQPDNGENAQRIVALLADELK
jgi:outer membrane protein assembly factor BamC